MKLAHVVIATPGRAGIYETARELVAAERAFGIDARVVDPKPNLKFYPKGGEDRGVPLAGLGWAANEADVILSHSGHDGTPVAESKQPLLHVAHGRPLSTFLMERDGGAPAYSYYVRRSKEERYLGCVTFWPEYEPYLRALWRPKPVHVIPATVDLEHWSPGPSPYDFAGKRAPVNVVMADPWSRKDSTPFHCIHAFELFRHIVPGARLHLYGADDRTRGYQALFEALGDSVGVVQGWASDLRTVYRAADMLITPHRIYTRSIREAMACGLQVVSGRDANPEDIEAFALAMARRLESPEPTRELATALFEPKRSAEKLLRIVESALSKAA